MLSSTWLSGRGAWWARLPLDDATERRPRGGGSGAAAADDADADASDDRLTRDADASSGCSVDVDGDAVLINRWIEMMRLFRIDS